MNQQTEIENKLREKILNIELLPGEKISERWAEQEFNVSRTPIRAALLRLEAEGLIQKEDRSWQVTPIDIDTIRQLFDFREILEVSALKLASASESFSDDVLAQIEKSIQQEFLDVQTSQRTKNGTDFHLFITSLSKNEFLISSLEYSIRRLYRVRWLDSDKESQGWDEHLLIFNALKEKNIELAVSLLSKHIRDSRDRLLNLLAENTQKFRGYGMKMK